MVRLFVLVVCVGLAAIGAPGPAAAELRFSSQRSLSLPDPFIKRKKAKPRSQAVEQREQRPRVLAAFAGPGYFSVLRKPRVRTPGAWGALHPDLLAMVAKIEAHFGAKALISSGCRTPEYNRAVGGALHSYHLKCMAADISIPGVTTAALRDYAMSLPERGGVGTYCSTPIVHVDVGPKRQWYWGCFRAASARRNPFDLY